MKNNDEVHCLFSLTLHRIKKYKMAFGFISSQPNYKLAVYVYSQKPLQRSKTEGT